MATIAATGEQQPTRKDIRLVITASSLGTVFEWYDFFIFGTASALIFPHIFFPDGDQAALVMSLATFGFAALMTKNSSGACAPSCDSRVSPRAR